MSIDAGLLKDKNETEKVRGATLENGGGKALLVSRERTSEQVEAIKALGYYTEQKKWLQKMMEEGGLSASRAPIARAPVEVRAP